MSEIPFVQDSELMTSIAQLPTEGIAYRMDTQRFASDGMYRERGGYIVLQPGPRSYETSPTVPMRRATELRLGFDYALFFALPREWWYKLPPPKSDTKRLGYHMLNHFRDPDNLPVISWATSPSSSHINAIYESGGRHINGIVCVARVAQHGPIPSHNWLPPISAKPEDIERAHVAAQDLANFNLLQVNEKRRSLNTEQGRAAEIFYSSLREILLGRFVMAISSTFSK